MGNAGGDWGLVVFRRPGLTPWSLGRENKLINHGVTDVNKGIINGGIKNVSFSGIIYYAISATVIVHPSLLSSVLLSMDYHGPREDAQKDTLSTYSKL